MVVGGHHATVSPEDYNIPAIDVIVLGEGVFTFKEILRKNSIRSGSVPVNYDDIPGLAIPGKTLKFTASRPYWKNWLRSKKTTSFSVMTNP